MIYIYIYYLYLYDILVRPITSYSHFRTKRFYIDGPSGAMNMPIEGARGAMDFKGSMYNIGCCVHTRCLSVIEGGDLNGKVAGENGYIGWQSNNGTCGIRCYGSLAPVINTDLRTFKAGMDKVPIRIERMVNDEGFCGW
jgi:hypothetical protein